MRARSRSPPRSSPFCATRRRSCSAGSARRSRKLAERTARERGARLIVAPDDPGPQIELHTTGAFQRRNFSLACAATEAFLGELDAERVRAVAAAVEIPGRLEQVSSEPPVFLDAAHNPDGARALAEALPEAAAGRPVVAVLAILADKDARAMTQALAPALIHAVCTQLPGADGPKSRAGAGQIGPSAGCWGGGARCDLPRGGGGG